MRRLVFSLVVLFLPLAAAGAELREYPLPAGLGPHDVAPAPDGGVWFTAQRRGALGQVRRTAPPTPRAPS
jgi:virginiamycin B lyase